MESSDAAQQDPVSGVLQSILTGTMPQLGFELPHWLYWATLALFPLVAMILSRRGRSTGYSLVLGYLILATGGMLGLHRFYLRNLWGFLYLPLFLGVLWANSEERSARETLSDTSNAVRVAERAVERFAPRIAGADARLEELRAELEAAEPESFAARRAERTLEREEERVERARREVAEAEAELSEAEPLQDMAREERAFWSTTAYRLFLAIVAFMAIDALLLPWFKARADRAAAAEPVEKTVVSTEQVELGERKSDEEHIGTGWTGAIDRLSFYAGEFVSYWAVIAVFVYYYEVVARYVFNSPTNWAHEGMFLMFGMQYLIAGTYAAMTEAHVRVDIFYARWSAVGKAWVDLFTSIFFFIFAGTLTVTGIIFAWDATVVDEISFSEWAIAYWPFKWAIVVGGALLLLQGVAKFARDIETIRRARANRGTA